MNDEYIMPIKNCEYSDPDDGCCMHPDNQTPECHRWACPLIDDRIFENETITRINSNGLEPGDRLAC